MRSELQRTRKRIPWMMAGSRAVLGPVMVIAERVGCSALALAALVVAALLSDIFDGVLARRWKCDTAGVRLFDSMADILFYLGCAAALWMRQPQQIQSFAIPIAAVIGMEAARLVFDLAKFGKPASYHSYLAKTWGLALAAALVAGFATEHAAVWIATAIALGVLCNVEGLAMSLLMPVWRQDVKTIAAAWRLRGAERNKPSQLVSKIIRTAVLLFALVALPLHAQSAGHAIYETGTAVIAANTIAPLMATAEGPRFDASRPLVIPYEKIDRIEWRNDVREHLGFFPAMFAGMFFARVRIYRMTLSYSDDAHKEHAAVFQVNRNDSITLAELLKARVPECRHGNTCQLPYND